MAPQTQTITVDRVNDNHNAIADQQHAGKTVVVPAGEVSVGREYDVRLVDEGSHFRAQVVDAYDQTQPSQPSLNPDTSDLAKGRDSDSHSHEIQSSPAGGRLRGTPGDNSGKKQRRRMSQRKK